MSERVTAQNVRKVRKKLFSSVLLSHFDMKGYLMLQKPAQPREIDQSLEEMAQSRMKGGNPFFDVPPVATLPHKSSGGVSISAYRAVYLNAHKTNP